MCAPEALPAIQAALGRKADAVLCDASPEADRDPRRGPRRRSRRSTWPRSGWPRRCSTPRGFLVVKGFPGQESDLFRKELKRRFASVHEVRPEGKRTTSKEFYWVASQAKPR